MALCIYVGNLSYNTSEGDLSSFFGQQGAIDSVLLEKDRETNRSKGFGYIFFSDPDPSLVSYDKVDLIRKTVIATNEQMFMGCRINVSACDLHMDPNTGRPSWPKMLRTPLYPPSSLIDFCLLSIWENLPLPDITKALADHEHLLERRRELYSIKPKAT